MAQAGIFRVIHALFAMVLENAFIAMGRGIINMKTLYTSGLIFISIILVIGFSRAGDVSVYDSDNFEIMHGSRDDGEIKMEDEGHIVSGSVDSDGHIFMYNYKTGSYIDGDVDDSGRGRVYDYATGEYYDIVVE